MIVNLQQTTYTISEGVGPLNVCAILTGTAERDVLVTLLTIQRQGAAQCKLNLQTLYSSFI